MAVEPLYLLRRVDEGVVSCVAVYDCVHNAYTVSEVSRLKTRHQISL